MAANMTSNPGGVAFAPSSDARLSVKWGSETDLSQSKGPDLQRSWPTDAELQRFLSNDEDLVSEAQAPEAWAAKSGNRLGSALDRLVASWAEIAVSHAAVRCLEDHSGHVATVAGIDGAWGHGDTAGEALDELRSVLVGWACLKLEDGDDDTTNMEGIHLVVKR